MKSSWQSESGHLRCGWAEAGRFVDYDFPWQGEASEMQSGYLEPVPGFASHSPFGGPDWFDLHIAGRTSK